MGELASLVLPNPGFLRILGRAEEVIEAMMLELVPEGVSKETGLRLLMEERGLAPSDVVAVGDGNNDVEMLRLAGAGVAVGNASEAALAAADHVVASSDEGGVAEAIRRFVL